MKRTENPQLNSPEYWDKQYQSEISSGKQRFDFERTVFVYNAIRDVQQYWPGQALAFLDAGCGSAELLNHVHAVFPTWKKYGLDFSPNVIDFCQQYNPHIEFKCRDVIATRYNDGQFYLTHCGETLEHVDDPERVVAELARITHPRGNLVISVPLMNQNPSPEHFWEFEIEDAFILTGQYGKVIDLKIVAGGLSLMWTTKIGV